MHIWLCRQLCEFLHWSVPCLQMHQELLKGAALLPAPCKCTTAFVPIQTCLLALWLMQKMLALPNNGTHAEPERLVRASVIKPKKIRICKRPNGKEWLLGRGAFGTVYPTVCILPWSAVTPFALRFFICAPFVPSCPSSHPLSGHFCICILPHFCLPLSLAVPAATPLPHIAPYCSPLLNTCCWSLFSLLVPHQF